MSIMLGIIALILGMACFFYYRQNQLLQSRLESGEGGTVRAGEAFSVALEKSNTVLSESPVDSMTFLPNREAFDERMKEAIVQAKHFDIQFAVMALEMDDFALLEQEEAGVQDLFLPEVGARLLSAIRQMDSLTRYAGSHFVLLLPKLSHPKTAAYVAGRIQESMLEPFVVDDRTFHLTVGIGIAIYPLDGQTVESLLRQADIALADAKRKGKNRYHFAWSGLQDVSEREQEIFSLLRSDRLFQHLVIRYSPGISAQTGQLCSLHASPVLLHPIQGETGDQELIKMAEHCGRGTEIMKWLFRHALEKACACQADNTPLILSMTITARQAENTHFVFQMTETARAIEHPLIQPIFEMGDSPARMRTSLLEQGIASLGAAGIHFGIQIQAIRPHVLQRFPSMQFRYLKMQAGLVERTLELSEGHQILSSMILLAKETGMAVAVDGVETPDQRERLAGYGFNILQGNLFQEKLPEKAEAV